MDIQASDLRYFFEAARSKNISRAAERLGIGQPSLSQAIQRLERILGAKLFDRFKTGIQLTPAGQRLLVEGKSALEVWERLKAKTRAAESEIQGHFTIGCHSAVGAYTLPKFLEKIFRKYPEIELRLRHALSREILEEVVSFQVDFGLVMNPAPHPDLVIIPLCEDRVSLYASPSGLKNILIFDPALAQSQALIRKLGKNTFQKFLHSSSLELIAELASRGCGAAILPERIARLHSPLQLLSKNLPFVRDQLCLIYRSDRHQSAGARMIVKEIREALSAHPKTLNHQKS